MTSDDPNQYPGGSPQPGQPPYQGGPPGQPPPPGHGYPVYGVPRTGTEDDALGYWSLGLGVSSIICCFVPFLTGVAAIIVGCLGVFAANEGRASNKVLSIIGIVLGAASIILNLAGFAFHLFSPLLRFW